ncbi:MAG: hypothetical protein E7559_06900 [Ruminococcaceae bacterium]|nr:hypothetical protein [Oscillospiraceae bacterium]
MASKAITIYTPAGTAPHIGAHDDAFIYDTLLGGRSGRFGGLECTAVSANSVQLSGGGAVNRGYIMYVPQDDTHTINIHNCAQGLMRHDLIVSEFTRGDGDTADSHVFAVVEGEAAAVPTDPALTVSELATAGDINQIALFRLTVGGTGITEVECIADDASQLTEVAHAAVAASCTGAAASAQTAATAQTAASAGTADALAVPRNISLAGDASASEEFDGTEDISLTVSVSKINGKRVYIQREQPGSPAEGDIWLW